MAVDLTHLGPRPNGSRHVSSREPEVLLSRLKAAVDMEQDITLSADECWVLLWGIRGLARR